MGTQYAQTSNLFSIGIPQSAFGQLTTPQLNDALEEASREVDARVAGRYGLAALPFLTWDSIITGITVRIACYQLLSTRGYNPAAGADKGLMDRYQAAIADCVKIQKQQLHPLVTVTTPPADVQPVVVTSSVVNLATGGAARNRGW